jgi:hypothetical protein
LAEASAILDNVRQQQRETGAFKDEDRLELVAKVAHLAGFFDGLDATGYRQMPADLGEKWAGLQEDTRDLRYVSNRPQ